MSPSFELSATAASGIARPALTPSSTNVSNASHIPQPNVSTFFFQIHRNEVFSRSGKVFCTFVLFLVLIVVNVVALMILVTVLMLLLLPPHLHTHTQRWKLGCFQQSHISIFCWQLVKLTLLWTKECGCNVNVILCWVLVCVILKRG